MQIFRPSEEKNEWSGSGIVFFDTRPIGFKYNKNKCVYFYLFYKKINYKILLIKIINSYQQIIIINS